MTAAIRYGSILTELNGFINYLILNSKTFLGLVWFRFTAKKKKTNESEKMNTSTYLILNLVFSASTSYVTLPVNSLRIFSLFYISFFFSFHLQLQFCLQIPLTENRLNLVIKLKCERASGDVDVGEVNAPLKELLDLAGNGKFTCS